MADAAAAEDTTYTQDELDTKLAEKEAEWAGFKVNRDELLVELKTLKDASKAFDGIDPKEHRALKKAAAETSRKKAEAEGDWEELEQKLVEHHQKDMDALKNVHGEQTTVLEGQLTGAAREIETLLIDSVGVAEIADAGGNTKVLLPHVKDHSRVAKDADGKSYVQVIDDTGQERLMDGKGKKMTIKDFVAELRQDPDFARNFEGSGSSGGGSSKSSGGAGGAGKIVRGDNKAFLANLDDIASGKVEVTT